MQRVISLFLPPNFELLETIKIYNLIVNFHISKSIKFQTVSKKNLHNICYYEIRTKYPQFPPALIQCARDNAVEMLKGNKYNPNTTKRLDSSIRFDLRAIKVFLESGKISFRTIYGRLKFHLKIPEYFQKYHNWTVKGCTLGLEKKKFKLKIIVEGVKFAHNLTSTLGIDLGLKNLAVLSNGLFIKSNYIRKIKRRYAYLRKQLQSKGTRSAKRKLQLLSGRERRFIIDYNHSLSKKIANLCYGITAMENLKNITEGRKGKLFNRLRSNWSFYQIRKFIKYKAEELGNKLILVNPKYTSQKCHKCDYIDKANRTKGNFKCLKCNLSCSADLNASRNISREAQLFCEQVVVNQPNIAVVITQILNLTSYKPLEFKYGS